MQAPGRKETTFKSLLHTPAVALQYTSRTVGSTSYTSCTVLQISIFEKHIKLAMEALCT